MDFRGLSQTRETQPFNPEALARGKQITYFAALQLYYYIIIVYYYNIAAKSLICSLVAMIIYELCNLQPCSLVCNCNSII